MAPSSNNSQPENSSKCSTAMTKRSSLLKIRRRRRRISRLHQQQRNTVSKQQSTSANKEHIKSLYTRLEAVIPATEGSSSSSSCRSVNLVLNAVNYINTLHRQVLEEQGMEALLEIQRSARAVMLQKYNAEKEAAARQSEAMTASE